MLLPPWLTRAPAQKNVVSYDYHYEACESPIQRACPGCRTCGVPAYTAMFRGRAANRRVAETRAAVEETKLSLHTTSYPHMNINEPIDPARSVSPVVIHTGQKDESSQRAAPLLAVF